MDGLNKVMGALFGLIFFGAIGLFIACVISGAVFHTMIPGLVAFPAGVLLLAFVAIRSAAKQRRQLQERTQADINFRAQQLQHEIIDLDS